MTVAAQRPRKGMARSPSSKSRIVSLILRGVPALCLAATFSLRADETAPVPHGTPLATNIAEVQLYSDQALIRRRGRMDLAAGTTIFRVKDLPSTLINDSVRMSLDEGGGRISEIRVETRHEKVF